MALTVNITKLATPYKVAPAAVAAPVRDNKGRFIAAAEAVALATVAKLPKKDANRTRAPYRINYEGDVIPYNGGKALANIWSPTLKSAMVKAGLVV